MDIEYVRSRFIKHFDGTTGAVYASPGRINLIGEHTDYNGGFVFPGAIDKGMIAEIKPNGTNTVKAYSIDLKDYVEFGLNEEDAPRASWARYIFGVCREMMKRGVDVKGSADVVEIAKAAFAEKSSFRVRGSKVDTIRPPFIRTLTQTKMDFDNSDRETIISIGKKAGVDYVFVFWSSMELYTDGFTNRIRKYNSQILIDELFISVIE